MQQEIDNPLARRILAGNYKPGDAVNVDVAGDAFAFQ
jgi:ATP-dependent Clp protease ATP-binding subunit ClpA